MKKITFLLIIYHVIAIFSTKAMTGTYNIGIYQYGLDYLTRKAVLSHVSNDKLICSASPNLKFFYDANSWTVSKIQTSINNCKSINLCNFEGYVGTLTIDRFRADKYLESINIVNNSVNAEVVILANAFGDKCTELHDIKLVGVKSIGSKAFYAMTHGKIVCEDYNIT